MDDKTLEKLIELKIKGAFDSYEVLRNNLKIKRDIEELKKDKRTLIELIFDELEVPTEEYKEYNEFFEPINEDIQNIKNRYNSQKFKDFEDKDEFVKWFINQPPKCCYCGVPKELLAEYFKESSSKRDNRGKSLEIERVLTYKDSNVYSAENCRLACYICNNAKSDFIIPKSSICLMVNRTLFGTNSSKLVCSIVSPFIIFI